MCYIVAYDRLHRVGLVEDASRCVMDIVEGRAAGERALAGATAGKIDATTTATPEVRGAVRKRFQARVAPQAASTRGVDVVPD